MITTLNAYNFHTCELPEVTQLVNQPGTNFFSSRVVSITIGDKIALVIIETTGSYPHIESQWQGLAIPD